ncbi:putative secreted protein (Por secretion system target) [Gillisia sp. Hel_I_86]|uniref:T9SS type A sorting domain-containing protein n=1 Tax=Gillisia sp. Hel_I_86 TaxID=1249981 RepID=UPI00119B5830|nr:T9SS type A sorting domain-containing protein [Gillisia sp. Hel_I_86]TVZ25135.1 putative secreted protein (Por secretion system target) [Gillisia sp. Hel_I_86]
MAYNGVGAFNVYLGGAAYDQPVIVLDGFDPFEGTDEGINVEDIYSQFLSFNNGANNLGLELRGQGFDIIPLNFIKGEQNDGTVTNGGTDYVERNAMVLVELIERINNSSCWSNVQPIKVIGFSMGGLIGRYALRYMEQNNIPHNTDLFVAVDTPHNGAVVPTGLQEAADFIEDIASIDIGDKILKSPAAKQMLVHHYLANSKTPAGAPNFHNRFYNTLNSIGFPQQTRNIAVSNGITTGTAINAPNQNYFNGEIETGANFPIIGIGADAKMKFSPERNQTNKVFDFKAKIRFLAFYITVYRRFQEVTTNAALGSYENSPGGFFTVEDEINQFLGSDGVFNTNETLLTAFIYQARAEISTPRFSFIPVKSSLAYTGNNQDLYEDFSTRNLVCTGETPFDSYFTASNDNEQHIALNSENANFIFDEITGVQRSPNIQINPNEQINGPKTVCSTIVTYNIANCTTNVNNWTASSNLEIVSSNGNSITVQANGNGEGFIDAVLPAGTVRKEVWVGQAKITKTTFGSCYEPNYRISATYPDTALEFKIYHNGTTTYQSGSAYYEFSSDSYNLQDGESTTVYISIRNNCGWSQSYPVLVYKPTLCDCGYNDPSCGGSGGPPSPLSNSLSSNTILHPNPADQTLYVNSNSLVVENKKDPAFQIELFDLNGRLFFRTTTKEVNHKMDVSMLKDGLYILHLSNGKERVIEKLIIKH